MRLLFLIALSAVASALPDNFLERQALVNRHRHERRQQTIQQAEANKASSAPPQFLTGKTRKFAVNGTGLPQVDFDVGESYAGNMAIGNSKTDQLFFWFFPSSTGVKKKEITIWLNGGPGCSSLIGLIHENGPFTWKPGTYGPKPNLRAWNKLTNMVYIEQPIGTGFTKGKRTIRNEVDLAVQFNAFWKNFVDTFDLQDFSIYVTGESYAGQYAPYIADAMLNQTDTSTYNVKGVLIYDPVVAKDSFFSIPAVPFMIANQNAFPFKEEVRNSLIQAYKDCGFEKFMNEGLVFPPPGPLPEPPSSNGKCDLVNILYAEAVTLNYCFNIYEVTELCPHGGDVLAAPGHALPDMRQIWLDRPDVKEAIHADPSIKWTECGPAFVGGTDHSPVSGARDGPIKRVAEKTKNMLVAHATRDMILFSNQTLLGLNDLVWDGAQGFNEGPVNPFMVPQKFYSREPRYKYHGAWTSRAGLTFLEINLAGHMVPQFAPGPAYRTLEVLLGRVPSLSSKTPFTP